MFSPPANTDDGYGQHGAPAAEQSVGTKKAAFVSAKEYHL